MTIGSTARAGDAHLDDATCADLVLGLLPATEREGWLAHATTCRGCEARLRSHVAAAERARADAATRATTPVRLPWRSQRTLVAALAVAAALVAVFAVPRLLVRDSGTARFELPLPGEEVHVRERPQLDAHLDAGLAALRVHDLAGARRELEAARVSGPAEQVRRLYLAQVRLDQGDAGEALVLLRGLDYSSIPQAWRENALRLLVRTLRAAGHGDSADSLADALSHGAASLSPRP